MIKVNCNSEALKLHASFKYCSGHKSQSFEYPSLLLLQTHRYLSITNQIVLVIRGQAWESSSLDYVLTDYRQKLQMFRQECIQKLPFLVWSCFQILEALSCSGVHTSNNNYDGNSATLYKCRCKNVNSTQKSKYK